MAMTGYYPRIDGINSRRQSEADRASDRIDHSPNLQLREMRRFCARFAMGSHNVRSFSIDQWCEMHNLSRAFFYKLASQGEAPKTFKVGRATRISEAANNEWLAAREAATSQAA
jgi:predicted DNA-binding transcriptional regulator AlpA